VCCDREVVNFDPARQASRPGVEASTQTHYPAARCKLREQLRQVASGDVQLRGDFPPFFDREDEEPPTGEILKEPRSECLPIS
jgi:hypothetical protein